MRTSFTFSGNFSSCGVRPARQADAIIRPGVTRCRGHTGSRSIAKAHAHSGAYTTTLSLNSQYFLWMPNGRIMRTRLNVSYAIPDTVSIEDVSVYGTGDGFRGHARPGRTFVVDAAWEYSLTRRWVLALDIVYQHDTSTTLSGFDSPAPGTTAPPTRVQRHFGSSDVFTLAPAVEYNWSSSMGVIVGTVFTAAGRNASANIVPVAAINMVF